MQKIRTYFEKFFRAIAMLALALIVAFPITARAPKLVKADYIETVNDFDETYVEDDLGKEKLLEYSLMVGTKPSVVSFMEYCYSDDESLLNAKYGLYIYVLNPTRAEYATNIGGNQINMAISHDSEGKPTSYKILKLKNCGHTTGEYDKLIYKFRVLGLDDVVKDVTAQNKTKSSRKYSVAELQLRNVGSGIITGYGVSRSFTFTGYAKGCGAGADTASTLTCTVGETTTIELEVGHTNYRTEDFVDNVCDEINTVYFSVPDEYFQKYGDKLQKIKAQWYEYKTKPVFVTSDSEGYAALKEYIGVYIGEYSEDLLWRVFWEGKAVPDTISGQHIDWYKNYNGRSGSFPNEDELAADGEYVPCIDWLFEQTGVETRDDYRVTSERVEEYMIWYTDKFPDQDTYSIPTAENELLMEVATGLFEDCIDADRIELLEDQSKNNGYICQEIDAGETQSLTVKKDQSFWDELWHGVKYEEEGLSPIVDLPSDIRTMSVDEFGATYKVNDTDKQKVYDYCIDELDKGNHPILFRFAKTEYYACSAKFDLDGNGMSQYDGYVAQETVFLGFDVISLTFRKDTVDTVIGVVSHPIDIINGFTPPVDLPVPKDKNSLSGCMDSVKKVFSVVVIAIGLTLLVKLLIALFNMIGSFGGGGKNK